MANKVYLLWYGEPMDRQVGGVFSTREAAEAALRFGDAYGEVEEREVDAPLPQGPAGRSLWYVSHEMPLDEYIVFREAAFEEHELDKVTQRNGDHSVTLWAQDEEDALRLGKELFGRFKERQALSA